MLYGVTETSTAASITVGGGASRAHTMVPRAVLRQGFPVILVHPALRAFLTLAVESVSLPEPRTDPLVNPQ